MANSTEPGQRSNEPAGVQADTHTGGHPEQHHRSTNDTSAGPDHGHHQPLQGESAAGSQDHSQHAHAGHTHGAVDPSLFASERGIWAVKWSLIGLLITAVIQVFIVIISGSVALLADTIHNFGDGLTAIPLWVAFSLGKRAPTRRFTYGYGRVEDLAGLFIVLMILISAVVAGYESFRRFVEPQEVKFLWAVGIAAIVGFLGNEGIALFRIKIGKEIGSASLVADGYHARVDGITSLAVLAGTVGVGLGYPLADPIAGLAITFAILKILWDSTKTVFTRLMDGVDPEIVAEIEQTLKGIPEIIEVTDIKIRWLGHRLHAEVHFAVDSHLTLTQAHEIANETHRQLLQRLNYLSEATIHVDPASQSGKEFHQIDNHPNDNHPDHPHHEE